MTRCVIWCRGLADKEVVGERLNLMILELLSNLNYSGHIPCITLPNTGCKEEKTRKWGVLMG